jgi:hypothetical protein
MPVDFNEKPGIYRMSPFRFSSKGLKQLSNSGEYSNSVIVINLLAMSATSS